MTAPQRNRRGRFLDHVPFLLVMAMVLVAAVRTAMYHWREGAAWIAIALVVAGVLRAVLSDAQIGMLAIRGKAIDVLSYLALGAMIMFVALSIVGGPLA